MEAKLTEERAELVASNGLLDQNERLRAAIVAEEREKFQSEKVPVCVRIDSSRSWSVLRVRHRERSGLISRRFLAASVSVSVS